MSTTILQRTATTLSGVVYAPGDRFVVTAEGVRLSGWAATEDGPRHWIERLRVGDVLTCAGFGFGDGTGFAPGFGVEWTTERSELERVRHVQLAPDRGGPWAHHPDEGCLQRFVETDDHST